MASSNFISVRDGKFVLCAHCQSDMTLICTQLAVQEMLKYWCPVCGTIVDVENKADGVVSWKTPARSIASVETTQTVIKLCHMVANHYPVANEKQYSSELKCSPVTCCVEPRSKSNFCDRCIVNDICPDPGKRFKKK